MANYGKDFKQNLKQLKNEVFKGNPTLENGLRKLLGKPLPKDELFKKYPKLEEYYDSIGNNPISEPELDFKLDEFEKSYFNDFYVQRLEEKSFNFDDIDFESVKLFAIKVATKVKMYEDDEGILKKIDKFDELDFRKIQKNRIKIAQIIKDYDEKIMPIKNEANENLDLMIDGYDPDIDDASEFENERKKLMKNLEEEIREITKNQTKDIDDALCKILEIQKDDFNEWEFTLLRLNALAVIDYNGHTPFMKGEL